MEIAPLTGASARQEILRMTMATMIAQAQALTVALVATMMTITIQEMVIAVDEAVQAPTTPDQGVGGSH